ncbi:hypothetical protein DB32_005678 [Sandaracinus amylolyticus]|uniref:Uncharacterized protein n=1 Tax=Sandaracinus amylolyticus TaxID=927083 RepID=A0A0F6SGE0_9BACT|nr:hypothetical protein DB32_005678 [Sandaracinus amylolyticus]
MHVTRDTCTWTIHDVVPRVASRRAPRPSERHARSRRRSRSAALVSSRRCVVTRTRATSCTAVLPARGSPRRGVVRGARRSCPRGAAS